MNTNIHINLFILSKWRTELMGFATLCIIICHAVPFGIDMPYILSRILSFGNLGVEFFLLLSGIGVYFSIYNKKSNWITWYKRRFIRILIPYSIITLPFLLNSLIIGESSFSDFVLNYSTLSFWLYHRGAWFIALIIPIYVISPVLYFCLTKSNFRCLYLLVFIGISIMFQIIHFDYNSIMYNISGAISRIPCFYIGMFIGNSILKHKKIKLIYLCVYVFLSFICFTVFTKSFAYWTLIFIVIPPLCLIFSQFQIIKSCFYFLGHISLESYLTNIFIGGLIKRYCYLFDNNFGEISKIIAYSLVAIIGILFASIVSKISSFLITKIYRNGI